MTSGLLVNQQFNIYGIGSMRIEMATIFLIYIIILKISLNFKNNNFYENSLRQCIYLYNTSNVKPLRISIFLQDFITDLRHSENALTPKDWKQILYPRISLSLSIPYLIL